LIIVGFGKVGKYVNQTVILGLIGLYLPPGIGFDCYSIEMIASSFNGIVERAVNPGENREDLLYFSFIINVYIWGMEI
jgi:hypothetical protein